MMTKLEAKKKLDQANELIFEVEKQFVIGEFPRLHGYRARLALATFQNNIGFTTLGLPTEPKMKTEFTINVPRVGNVDVVRQLEDKTNEPFWDLFDCDGNCLNEGDPFWTKPTRKDVFDFFKA